MATFTKCDRCGKTIERRNTTYLRFRKYGYSMIRLTEKLTNEIYHDLCEDCTNSYYAWFNHPERDTATD